MALSKVKTFKLSTAYFFFAPQTGVAAPGVDDLSSDAAAIDALEALGYNHIGYTSSDEALSASSEGGGTESTGPLQAPKLFTDITAPERSFIFKIWEWSAENLKLAFGANAVTRADGAVGQAPNPTPSSGTWLVLFKTVEGWTYFHAPRADLIVGDDFGAIGGNNSFGDLPVKVMPKSLNPGEPPFYVLPITQG